MTREEQEVQIRNSGNLPDRLTKVIEMVGNMCTEGRPPHMSIPVQWDDEDVYIVVTVYDAIEALRACGMALVDREGIPD